MAAPTPDRRHRQRGPHHADSRCWRAWRSPLSPGSAERRRVPAAAPARLPGAPPTQEAQHGAHEQPAHLGTRVRVVGAEPAHARRQGQHPLPYWHLGQQAIDEPGGGVGHAPAAARGAEASALAGEGDQLTLAPLAAAQDREASLQHAAVEVAPELAAHEPGQRPPRVGVRPGQERGQVLGDHLVQHRALRLTPPPFQAWLLVSHQEPVPRVGARLPRGCAAAGTHELAGDALAAEHHARRQCRRASGPERAQPQLPAGAAAALAERAATPVAVRTTWCYRRRTMGSGRSARAPTALPAKLRRPAGAGSGAGFAIRRGGRNTGTPSRPPVRDNDQR